eukprot:5856099-Pyramimonas_sp.AAC.1
MRSRGPAFTRAHRHPHARAVIRHARALMPTHRRMQLCARTHRRAHAPTAAGEQANMHTNSNNNTTSGRHDSVAIFWLFGGQVRPFGGQPCLVAIGLARQLAPGDGIQPRRRRGKQVRPYWSSC